jgi:3-isopropylmalate dehydrogenase
MAMMLRYSCHETAAADAVEAAVRSVIAAGYRTADLYSGAENEIAVGTAGMGDAIVAALR